MKAGITGLPYSGKTTLWHNGNLTVDSSAALGDSYIEFRADRGWEAHSVLLSQGNCT